jgi:hypothetical protein
LLQRVLFLLSSFFIFQNINLYFILDGLTTRRIGLLILFSLFCVKIGEIDLKKVDKFHFNFVIYLFFLLILHFTIFRVSFLNSYSRELLSGIVVLIMFSLLFDKFREFNLRDIGFLALFSTFNFVIIFIQFKEYGEFSIFSLRAHNVVNTKWNLNNFFNSLIFFSPLYLLGLQLEKKILKKLLYLILFGTNMFVVILSTSRQAIFGSFILLLPFIINRLNFKFIIISTIIIVSIVFSVLFEYVDFIIKSFLSRFNGGSDNYRLNKYLDTFDFFSENLIGIGLGNNIALKNGPLESSYLQILIELGFIGLFFSFFFFSGYFFRIFNSKNIITKYLAFTVFFISLFNEMLLSTSGILILFISYKLKDYKTL